jgi:aldehyde:ferredoxin oxidoreductase
VAKLQRLIFHPVKKPYRPWIKNVGERIVNLERLFNLKTGMTVADDTLPKRYLQEPLPDGAAEGKTVPLKQMLRDYYSARDWDLKTGYPSAEKLKSLNLETE